MMDCLRRVGLSKNTVGRRVLLGLACVCLLTGSNAAIAAEPKSLLESIDSLTLKPESQQVSAKREMTGVGTGIGVTIEPGNDQYPGLAIKPADGSAWDLSQYGHVEVRIVNTGETQLNLSFRADNAGNWQNNPWNTESRSIKPGEASSIKVIFGYAYGFKPGYKLDSSKVSQVLLFTGKMSKPGSYRIESITAGGEPGEKPPVNAADVRVKPKDGFLLGNGVPLDLAKQVATKDAAASAGSEGVQVTFNAGNGERRATFKPAIGRWDLRDAVQATVELKNTGASPVSPRVRVESNRGPTDWAKAESPLAPGESRKLTVSFKSAAAWEGPEQIKAGHLQGKSGTGSQVGSDAVSGVVVAVDGVAGQEQSVAVQSILADAPVAEIPNWLGQRPPVEGDWVLTFEDNFNGDSIDLARWNIYTENYWDKRSHFTKDNVVLGDGVVKLRYEKKRGHENDDPSRKETDYAVGFLDTYGKWAQRYGYFEARMKLPEAPGLWPAFWTMPDRGVDKGPQWVRADTKNGGMEFDILEHLTRWGPHRYNIGIHWDGYQKEHKATGTDRIYAQHDKDGFITAGLLWLPGKAVFYANGVEVARWENERVCNVRSYPILYMVSGGWDNNALDDAQLPADFVIDYIRIWQRKDLASDADSPAAPDPAK